MPPQTSNNYKQDNKISCANNLFISSSASPSSSSNKDNNAQAMADAGSSGNYITVSDKSCLQNLVDTNDRTKISVTVANGQQIHSSHVGKLALPDGTTIPAYVFKEINGSLLSISAFIDAGYTVLYDAQKVSFIKNNKTEFSGRRDKISKLWMVNLNIFNRVTSLKASPAIHLQNKEQFVRYWHACFGFPSKTTFVKAQFFISARSINSGYQKALA